MNLTAAKEKLYRELFSAEQEGNKKWKKMETIITELKTSIVNITNEIQASSSDSTTGSSMAGGHVPRPVTTTIVLPGSIPGSTTTVLPGSSI